MRRYSRQPHLLALIRKLDQIRQNTSEQVPDVQEQRRSWRVADRFSAEELAELVRKYQSGVATTALCEQYGMSKSSVLKTLRDACVAMRRQPLTHALVQQAAGLYQAGASLSQISAQMGQAQSSLRDALIHQGVVMRPAVKS